LIFDGSNPVILGMLWIIPLKQNTPQSPEPTMRQERTVQATVFDIFAEHEIGRELNAMSRWLDQQRSLLSLVAADLSGHGIKETGRHGLPAEAVLRCALLKQYRQLSYVELAFHLEDSASFISFARLPLSWSPKKSVLQQTISAISAASWEAINRAVLSSARQQKLDDGSVVRIDSTVTEALMHAPTDSSLLWDGVRVMVRLLKQAETLLGATPFTWRNHRRLAKKRAAAIQYSRGKRRKAKLYRDLITATRATMASLRRAAQHLLASGSIEAVVWRCEVEQYLPLIERVIDQTERRVFAGEAVPAGEKLVSLFETHTDIIVKGGRDVHYGHKLNLTTGRSGLVFDVVVEAGNPADSERFLPMLERHIARQDIVPRQTASDGGYASIANLEQAKALGVHDVVFHKKRGMAIEDMAKSRWVYRKLRNFRAGIEANISCLKRAFGLDRCTWRGLAHFQSYVWSSVVAYNLTLLARLAQL
jgi:IS5 family transposase